MTASSETLPSAVSARAFVLQGAFWSLALFGLVRLPWFDDHLVGALVEFQRTLVFWYGSNPNAPIVVNSSCSGADVMALCAAVTLAYPVAWRRRISGALAGIAVILLANVIRIATLYAAASRPATLQLLHLYVWPAILSAVAVTFVVLWIRRAEGGAASGGGRWRRFAVLSAGFLLVYAASVPWVFTSTVVGEVGAWTAAAGGFLLQGVSPTVHVQGNVLATGRGAFQVTQECLFTPMLPLYLAAVLALPASFARRAIWVVVAVPLFFALGVARLLVLALPPVVVESPAMLAHGFYQLMAGCVVVVVAAHLAERRGSGEQASRRTLLALIVALVAGLTASLSWLPLLDQVLIWLRPVLSVPMPGLREAADAQGALTMLPAYQIGLFAGLWVAITGPTRWRALPAGLVLLGLSQLLLVAGLGVLEGALSIEPHTLLVRGWAVAFPLALARLLTVPGATLAGDRAYLRFWSDVGAEFPSLSGSPSTTYYFENEKRLISRAVPDLCGRTVLKTDLWDEAKNTRILQWMADQGARVFAVDLSEPIVRQAVAAFDGRVLRPALSDVRRLPFGEASFDVIYSMGTIEHFAETEAAVVELARVLKPGGRLILGVPNRHDPFLRPAMVWVLHQIGLYGYGYEKSYSRRQLAAMLRRAGLDVTLESGVLFMPGLLRMIDLWCFTRARFMTPVTRALMRPFVWLDACLPSVRRHGYLLASVGAKPIAADRPEQALVSSRAATELTWELPAASSAPVASVELGVAYAVDARGCDPDRLRSLPHLQRVFSTIMEELHLTALAPPAWHVFPGEGGVTGMVLLSESHLTVHTYPEAGVAAIDLYCCRRSVEWGWEEEMRRLLGASEVSIRAFRRG